MKTCQDIEWSLDYNMILTICIPEFEMLMYTISLYL